MNNPLVSIVCITYNQEKFIAQALDGFLMQKTNFSFEILIHDDASTDSTAKIIKEYATKHPDIIKPTYEKENQYSKNTWKFLNDMFYVAKGKYIATCEGDDFWTDPDKLQKQVIFLEKHSDYALCFHGVKISYEDSKREYVSPADDKMQNNFTLENLLKDNFIHTCSVMYRTQKYQNIPNDIMPQDLYMHVYHAMFGKIGFINDVMAVYRKQSGGVWWDSQDHMDKIYMKHHFMLINLYAELLKLLKSNKKYETIIHNHLKHLLNTLLDIDKNNNTTIFDETTRSFPEIVSSYSREQNRFIGELRTELDRLNNVIQDLKITSEELEKLKNSRWHKLNPKNLKKQ